MDFAVGVLFGIFRSVTPLIFASLGGLLSERSGVVQIALEGMMLMGALAGAIVGFHTESPYLGFFFGGIAGLLISALFAFFVIQLKTDQIIAGTGINILAFGLAPFITKILFDSTGSTPSLPMDQRFTYQPMIIVGFIGVLIFYLYHYTQWGLLLRFCGEKPLAVTASGNSVSGIRWAALLGTGFLAGLGGASLSLFLASNFAPQMTAGRGFIALAALILGRWRPLPTIMAAFFFALLDSLPLIIQYFNLEIPSQLIQAIPYIIAVIAITGFFGKSEAPESLGQRT
jgi:ABC-type uncharacterized transport system permease subunit